MKGSNLKSNKKVAGIAFSTAASMLILAFGFVPLYDIFCDITGFAGTPKVSKNLPSSELFDEKIKVRFDSNVDKELYWQFKPEVKEIEANLGQQFTIAYIVKNKSNTKSIGISSFNVTPNKAAQYFNKIECFCFQEQTLGPGESMSMPVTFYVDPEIINDKYAKEVKTITLSYTFFKSLDGIPEINLEENI
ncbi:MAG: cytochrome c oxidase assembly protein [Alphaproteobacteria bacterium TMED87]|nr:cytochrome c oxidase assembly protein [Rhodospirillaceae bacterium]OUV08078.1 MAG: cytochrome c oxidase assembly protein [Alphaproteobacteria bacterium TMED87]|tara:strand:+ start:596 stop:1168 length:573 start_codon:yes stop_codon:yes gene_type:complete